MQTLNREQLTQLRDLLAYLTSQLPHPDEVPIKPVYTLGELLNQNEVRANRFNEYLVFRAQAIEWLMQLDTYQYPKSLDGTVETQAPKAAVLGDLLAAPEKFEHLGHREPVVQATD